MGSSTAKLCQRRVYQPSRLISSETIASALRNKSSRGRVTSPRIRTANPGPGLAIRIPGEITEEKLEILRKADVIYLEEIRNAGLYDAIWQAFAVLLPVKTVGVMGDSRSYDHVCALRAVTSLDGMTADSYPFPHEFLARVATRIINEVRGINRVVYDVTSKPPGTIEWE